jgi:hypothetical protein
LIEFAAIVAPASNPSPATVRVVPFAPLKTNGVTVIAAVVVIDVSAETPPITNVGLSAFVSCAKMEWAPPAESGIVNAALGGLPPVLEVVKPTCQYESWLP